MIYFYSSQINVSGLCHSTDDHILVDTTDTNIVIVQSGACIVLHGVDTIANYTKVLLSARLVCIIYMIKVTVELLLVLKAVCSAVKLIVDLLAGQLVSFQ